MLWCHESIISIMALMQKLKNDSSVDIYKQLPLVIAFALLLRISQDIAIEASTV